MEKFKSIIMGALVILAVPQVFAHPDKHQEYSKQYQQANCSSCHQGVAAHKSSDSSSNMMNKDFIKNKFH